MLENEYDNMNYIWSLIYINYMIVPHGIVVLMISNNEIDQ